MYRRHLSCLALLLALAAPAGALESDRSKPIDVDAGSAEFDEATGVTVLSGGVLLVQGSLQINTETATIHRDPVAGTINRIVLDGSPATIEQELDEQPTHMKARAQRIDYDLIGQTVTLVGAAELDQGNRHFSGARFEYDIARSRVKAQSSPEGDGRVRMTFDPATDPATRDNPAMPDVSAPDEPTGDTEEN